MKRILATILLALTFTVMFTSTSFAGWTKVTENVDGNTFYVDFERIRKHDGYADYWELEDFLKPNLFRFLSGKTYNQGDCKLFRYKTLSHVFHQQPLGQDTGSSYSPKNPQWRYPYPGSVRETLLKTVCDYAK